jgi:hypothetical protein
VRFPRRCAEANADSLVCWCSFSRFGNTEGRLQVSSAINASANGSGWICLHCDDVRNCVKSRHPEIEHPLYETYRRLPSFQTRARRGSKGCPLSKREYGGCRCARVVSRSKLYSKVVRMACQRTQRVTVRATPAGRGGGCILLAVRQASQSAREKPECMRRQRATVPAHHLPRQPLVSALSALPDEPSIHTVAYAGGHMVGLQPWRFLKMKSLVACHARRMELFLRSLQLSSETPPLWPGCTST